MIFVDESFRELTQGEMDMTRRVMSSGVVLMAAMWTACACTTAGVRGPTSAGDTKVQIQGDLHSQVEDMLGFVQSPRLTPENCGPVLSDIFKQAFALNPTQLDVATLRGRGAQIIENLFLI
ncbi:MAG: hypothetical protein NDI61_10140, partial [Bdellovibrionaceae bacterium]|nr:hypothetical protein [Pseudobdellovibrionaceae bacterium]